MFTCCSTRAGLGVSRGWDPGPDSVASHAARYRGARNWGPRHARDPDVARIYRRVDLITAPSSTVAPATARLVRGAGYGAPPFGRHQQREQAVERCERAHDHEMIAAGGVTSTKSRWSVVPSSCGSPSRFPLKHLPVRFLVDDEPRFRRDETCTFMRP